MNALQWLEKYGIVAETFDKIESEDGWNNARRILQWLANTKVRVSKRAMRSLGHAKYWHLGARTEIVLNDSLLKHSSREEQIDTLLHEIAHVIDYLYRGKSDHGTEWKRIARMVGATPRSRSKSVGNEYRYHNAKYIWRCENSGCEFETLLMRKKKHPINRYYCPRCKSRLWDATNEVKVAAKVAK